MPRPAPSLTVGLLGLVCFVLGGCLGSDPVDASDRVLKRAILLTTEVATPEWKVTLIGSKLTVSVTTFGDGCRTKGLVRGRLNSRGRVIVIEPLDSVTVGVPCESIELSFDHVFQAALPSGDWTVLLVGDGLHGEALQFEKYVTAVVR